MMSSSWTLRILGITFLAAMSALLYGHTNSLETKMRTKMDPLSPRLQPIFAKTKTICIGRYLIDVPVSSEVVYGPSQVPFDIRRLANKANALPELIAARLLEIEDERDYAETPLKGSDSMVGKVLNGASPEGKIVFGVSKTSGRFYNIHSYVKVGNDVYIQKTQATGAKDKYGQSVRELNLVAANLRARAQGEIPIEPGICIDGAIVLDLPEAMEEEVSLGVRLKEIPDVHFSMSMTKNDRIVDSDALEPRLAAAERDAERAGSRGWFSRIKFLRRGDRLIEGWSGQEVLAHKPAQESEGESHEFLFVSQGEPKNPLRPVLDIQLDTGVDENQTGAKPPGVTDEEAIQIWDRLISTIRVRPTGGAKASQVAPKPAPPRGALAVAGESCPASGWWRCTDGTEKFGVTGGRIQYFKAGEQVPQALLLPPASLWQRLMGEQPTFRSKVPSSWRLVDRRKNPRSTPSTLLAEAGPPTSAESDEITKRQSTRTGEQANIDIGALLSSGTICTASGWWECLEPGALDKTRSFSNGMSLPPATKPVSLTMFEKMKGVAEFVRVPATWRLVRFADFETVESTEGSTLSTISPSDPDTNDPAPSQGA